MENPSVSTRGSASIIYLNKLLSAAGFTQQDGTDGNLVSDLFYIFYEVCSPSFTSRSYVKEKLSGEDRFSLVEQQLLLTSERPGAQCFPERE